MYLWSAREAAADLAMKERDVEFVPSAPCAHTVVRVADQEAEIDILAGSGIYPCDAFGPPYLPESNVQRLRTCSAQAGGARTVSRAHVADHSVSVTRYVDDVVSLSLCARVRNPALEPARGSASQSGGGELAEKRDR